MLAKFSACNVRRASVYIEKQNIGHIIILINFIPNYIRGTENAYVCGLCVHITRQIFGFFFF